MKVTKQQRVYFGLLAIGLVALAVDRLTFSPSSAEASESPELLLVAKPAGPAGAAANVSSKAITTFATNPVAQKLVALSESMHLTGTPTKDAFSPSLAWSGKPTVALIDTKSFEATHSLEGVMVSGRHPAAMIAGKLVSVGESIDGYKLVSVADGAATLQSGETLVKLHSR